MKEKITQWAEKVSTMPKCAWGTMLAVISIPAITALIIGIVSPQVFSTSSISIFIMTLVGGFIGSMIGAGLLSWASKILGLEKKGFVRALGITSFAQLLLLPLNIIILVLFAFLIVSPVVFTPILVVLYIGMIVASVILMLFLYANAYGITKGQAFGLAATAYALLAFILLGIFGIIALIFSFIIPTQLENIGEYQQMQMDAMMQSGDFQLDEQSMAELQAAFEGLDTGEGVAEETEL